MNTRDFTPSFDKLQSVAATDYDAALSSAITNNHVDEVDRLLKQHPDHYIHLKNQTPHIYDRVIKAGQEDMLAMLLTNHRRRLHSPAVSLLQLAIEHGNHSIMTQIVACRYADVNSVLPNSMMPVAYADRLKQHNLAETMVKLGAEDNTFNLIKADLKQAIKLIRSNSWTQQGMSFFAKKLPRGVVLLRSKLGSYREQDIDRMPRGEVFALAQQLKQTVQEFKPNSLRSAMTQSLYRVIGAIGEGNNDSLYTDLQHEIDRKALAMTAPRCLR